MVLGAHEPGLGHSSCCPRWDDERVDALLSQLFSTPAPTPVVASPRFSGLAVVAGAILCLAVAVPLLATAVTDAEPTNRLARWVGPHPAFEESIDLASSEEASTESDESESEESSDTPAGEASEESAST